MGTVVVLGGTGEMGRRVVAGVTALGHDAVIAARSTGVDVVTVTGLDAAFSGADVVLDCLNHTTLSRRAAVDFFASSARRVVAAATGAGVGHLVCLSIVNVTDPAVRRATGYYAGKAAQEDAYAAAPLPVSVVRTTAWFTLAETFLGQLRVGRFAVVPRMGLRPVHPDAAADLLARTATGEPPAFPALEVGPTLHELAGPDRTDAAEMARAVAAAWHPQVRVVGVPAPGAGLRTGLLPRPDVPTDPRAFADWVRSARR